jgi:hypothetical protein
VIARLRMATNMFLENTPILETMPSSF